MYFLVKILQEVLICHLYISKRKNNFQRFDKPCFIMTHNNQNKKNIS